MDDQIIDSAMALSLHTDACRTRPLVGWVVMRDPPDYPGKVTARLITTDRQSPYVLVADTLAEFRPRYRLVWSGQSGSRQSRRKWLRSGFE